MNLQIKHKQFNKIYTVYAADPPASLYGRGFTRFLVFEPESNDFEWVFSGDFIPYIENKSKKKSNNKSKRTKP